MDDNKLRKAKEMDEIIKVTKKGLENLEYLKIRNNLEDRHYDDGLYCLCISGNKDGSGPSANLTRYYGNAELYEIIIMQLKIQLDKFNKEFEELNDL